MLYPSDPATARAMVDRATHPAKLTRIVTVAVYRAGQEPDRQHEWAEVARHARETRRQLADAIAATEE